MIRLYILAVISLTMLWGCKNNEIVFPEQEKIASIYGTIEQKGLGGVVYLIDAEVIDSAIIDTTVGAFEFHNVPFGKYILEIKTTTYPKYRDVFSVFSHTVNLRSIKIPHYPFPVSNVSPPHKEVFTVQKVHKDSCIVRFWFTELMSEESILKGLTVEPPVKYDIDMSHVSFTTVTMRFNSVHFFDAGGVTITLDTTAETKYLHKLSSPLTMQYAVDSTDISEVMYARLVKNERLPRFYNEGDTLTLFFKRQLKTDNLFEKITFDPAVDIHHILGDSQNVHIILDEDMRSNKKYTLTLDSGIVEENGFVYTHPIKRGVSTAPFRNLTVYPTKKSISPTEKISLLFNKKVDKNSFKNSFSIVPNIDVDFIIDDYTVTVLHEPLIDSAYTIVVDSNLVNVLGDTVFKSISMNYTVIPDSNGVIITIPDDTTEFLRPNEGFTLLIPYDFHREFFRRDFNITPMLLYRLNMRDTTITINGVKSIYTAVTVQPQEYFQSNKMYTITIDSLLSKNKLKLYDQFTHSFTTGKNYLHDVSPENGSNGVEVTEPLFCSFTVSVSGRELLKHIRITPAVDSLWIDSLDTKSYRIYHTPFDINKKYEITISDSLIDIYGNGLDRPFTYSFMTGQ